MGDAASGGDVSLSDATAPVDASDDGGDGGSSCSPGMLDPSFGTSGLAHVSLPSPAQATAVKTTPTRIVVGGTSYLRNTNVCTVVALDLHGTLDATFGIGGVARVAVPNYSCELTDIALMADGRIVGVGMIAGEDDGYPVVIRLLADGTQDPSFGTNGVLLRQPNTLGHLTAVAIDADERILASGYTTDSDAPLAPTYFEVLRYLPSGVLDPSFAGTGSVRAFPTGDNFAQDITTDSEGRVLVVGASDPVDAPSSFAIARFSSSGELDATFDSDGMATVVAGSAFGLALTALGALVVGDSELDGRIARVDAAGQLDPTFGSAGTVISNATFGDVFQAVRAIDGGALYVVGWRNLASTNVSADAIVQRRHADGSLDLAFGNAGSALVGSTATGYFTYDVDVQDDGKIVIAGAAVTLPQLSQAMLIARLCP